MTGLAAWMSVCCQECTLTPQKFFFFVREVAHIQFAGGAMSKGLPDTVSILRHYSPSSGITALLPAGTPRSSDSIRLPLGEEGTHMVVIAGNSSPVYLSPDAFAAALKNAASSSPGENGFILRSNSQPVYISNQYSAKTIVQVGSRLTDNCIAPTGLPLEIIPAENPYTIPKGTDRTKPLKVRFQVLVGTEGAPDIPVMMQFRRADGSTGRDTVRTNRRGIIEIERRSGPVLLSSAYMEQTPSGWRRYGTSLSFEFSRFSPGKSAIYTAQP